MTGSPFRVLLVEDNPGDVLLIEETLAERPGMYELETAERLAVALERLRAGGIDLVLLDLTLPDSEGVGTFTSVHSHVPDVPIIVLTGQSDESLAVSTVRSGAQDYLLKGQVASDLLARTIRYAIERHQVQRQLKRTEQQLLNAQKMEAMGRLAGGVAHDFNNLLTAILGTADLLLEDLVPSDPQHVDIQEIRKAAMRAADLTRQLLAFSRRQMLEPEVLDLNALVADMDKMVRRLIGEDVEFTTALSPDLGRVRADPSQLEQVILNLVVNARDAMPEGGKLTIETVNAELDESARGREPVRPGPYVLLAVSDTGIGMTEETKARLFEPFFTTKGEGKGTGLGLATVYGIIKQSGSHIWVYSEPEHGATFKVYFPRVEEPATPRERGPREPVRLRGTETILVVEDDESVRRTTCRILESLGYRVLAADGGAMALDLLKHHAGPLDLLVSDVVMPGLSGRKVVELVREVRPGLKALYLSGYTDEAIVRHRVLEAGIPFLQKPYSVETLARKIRGVLDG